MDSAYFASFLKQDKLNLFPAAAYTERPATACARLCEGKAVVLVAGCPYALIIPSFFAEHFECLDDYASSAVFAGLIRILKYLAFLLAVFGPGLYVMAVAFAPEIIPIQLLTKLAQGETSTPLPPMMEMLCVTLLLEIVREAGLRAPQSISHTVSLVGALIIGETAVSAGIVSVPVLTMAAAATIATLAVPSLYEQTILFRFAVILLAGCFGLLLAFAAVSKSKIARKLVQIFVTIFRNTPILILVYITYFGMPTIGINIPKVPSFVITLALYSSAYMEEVFRAGLEAIPKGIIEAGQAIGLSGTVIKIEIELPIMMKKVLPSMGNYLISLFKDTSIASAITVGELTYISKVLTTQTFRVFEVWLTTGILYVAACYLIAFILRRVEKLFL